MADRRPLSYLSRDISRVTGQTIPYRRLYNAVVDGRIQARLGENGRWTYRAEDVPGIAAALGLTAAQAEQVAA
jgi:hypothetical protein